MITTSLCSAHLLGQSESSDWEATEAEKIFALTVRPLLREKCIGCHGEESDDLKSGFDIRSLESVLHGGESYGDSVLTPGDPDASSLLAMVSREEAGFEMPPKESERLTEDQVDAVRKWIQGGAPWPSESRVALIYDRFAAGIRWPTSGGLSDEWTNRKYKPEDLWAYQPIVREEISGAKKSAVDYFINAKMESLGIEATVAADRTTLIRRATFDLHGLPPRPEDVSRFVADPRPLEQAFSDVVDRLLDSPSYGEQWGRHWLDVARYADSSGFANDWERPNAWRYRDYVIRSFNDDKPYDQFVKEQIAGDEIAESSSLPLESDKRIELLVASGFLRMGPWEHTGMSVAKITRQLFLDDITDSVGQVFLAHPLQCARCHDHKFDPIPTQDYYSFQAVFATTQFADLDTAWHSAENLNGMQEDEYYHSLRNEANERILKDVSEEKRKLELAWLQERDLPYKSAVEAKKAGAPPEHVPPAHELLTPDMFGRERIGRKWQKRFPWEADRYRPIAFSVYNGKTIQPANATRLMRPKNPMGKGVLAKTVVLTGGDPFASGAPVNPGLLSAVPGAMDYDVPGDFKGRRTALAEWIVSAENTLTPRVMVNRIWLYHFGGGLAGNPNNFGATGKKPTHPQLLDWLASEFVTHDWSIKHMHRLMMNSDVYRRSSKHDDMQRLGELDPTGISYARFLPRRMVAEELRDSMLSVSGELNLEMGGIPVRPDVNLEAALQPRMIMGTFAPAYVPNPLPSQRNRRTVYALKLRGHRDPFLETFNQPGTDKSCELRDSSTVSPQALTLFNSAESMDRALAFASSALESETQRGEVEHGAPHSENHAGVSDVEAIEKVFLRAYSRLPTEQELNSAIAHWKKMLAIQEQLSVEPRNYPVEVVREAVEENTGEPFQFKERLFVYQDYEPDLEACEVDARTRALADICLAILNSNEFVYIY